MEAQAEKRPIVVFGEDWGAHPSSTQHLMKRLAADRQIIWVNSIGLRRPRINRRDLSRAVRKVTDMVAPRSAQNTNANDVPQNVTVIQPRALSWPGNPIAAALNGYLLPQCLAPAVLKLAQKPILWSSLPSAIDAVGKLGEHAVVYYAGDDFSGLSGVDHAPVANQERRLIEHADLVIGASDTIAAKLGNSAVVLPHGYDENLFTTPAPRAEDLPSDGPVAGFYGSLSEWLDQDLIARTADLMPHWTFVFVGPVQTDVSALRRRSNIRLLGPRDHNVLPRYSQHWTASLLPFVDNRQIRACNPLKLREYLAAGQPVVSTPFPALKPYLDVVDVVNGPDQLCAMLMKSAHPSGIDRACRRVAVSGESWETRARHLDRLLDGIAPIATAA